MSPSGPPGLRVFQGRAGLRDRPDQQGVKGRRELLVTRVLRVHEAPKARREQDRILRSISIFNNQDNQGPETAANLYLGCNVGGVVVGGSCGGADTYPASSNITANGFGPSGDGTAWICKTTNTDPFNSHPVAYGSLCSYPVNAGDCKEAGGGCS